MKDQSRVFFNGLLKSVPHAFATHLKHVEYAFRTLCLKRSLK